MFELVTRLGLEVARLTLESAPYLLLGFLLAGVLHEMVPTSWIRRRLGGERASGVLAASLVGLPLPLCSCAVVPTAESLRRKGAGRSSTLAFLISTPETSIDSVVLTWGFFGWPIAIFRVVVAVTTAFVAGLASLAVDRLQIERASAPEDDCSAHAGAASCEHAHHAIEPGFASEAAGHPDSAFVRTRRALEFGFGPLFDDLAPSIAIGLLAAALVSVALPDELISELFGSGGIVSMASIAVVSTPLYLCASAATPLAAALVAKGLSLGSALVLLLVGPATNAATIRLVARHMGRETLIVYLAAVVGTAIAAGLALDAAAPGWAPVPSVAPGNDMHAQHSGFMATIERLSAMTCAILALRGPIRRAGRRARQALGSVRRIWHAPGRLNPPGGARSGHATEPPRADPTCADPSGP